jgi:hypothetical protein
LSDSAARRFRDDLVIGRVHVVGELDLDAGAQAIGGHADRGADDAELVDRRIEAAADLPYFCCRPGCSGRRRRRSRHPRRTPRHCRRGPSRRPWRSGSPRSSSCLPCQILPAAAGGEMRRHLGIDALEDVARRRLAARMQGAEALGLLLRLRSRSRGFRLPPACGAPRTRRRRSRSDAPSASERGSPSGQPSDSVFGR